MKNKITITLRQFPVLAHDHRTGKEEAITVPVTKEQLRAAQLVGQSSTELVERLCDRQGYTVIEIGQPDKLSIPLNLEALVKQYEEHQEAGAKWGYLYGGGAE
jgi:hypothetical protein